MAYNFLPCDRNQAYLLPPSLTDWLPEDHLAWFAVGQEILVCDRRVEGPEESYHRPVRCIGSYPAVSHSQTEKYPQLSAEKISPDAGYEAASSLRND